MTAATFASVPYQAERITDEPSVPTSGRVGYDGGYPVAVTDPDSNIITQLNDPNVEGVDTQLYVSPPMPLPEASASLAYLRGGNASIGGKMGEALRLGYTSGLAKLDRNVHHFTGRYVRFDRRDLAKDTGPVGRSNYSGKLYSGVEQQFSAALPPLEEIYRGFTGG